jgi:hypothetical protein
MSHDFKDTKDTHALLADNNETINIIFSNCNEDELVFSLTTREIIESQSNMQICSGLQNCKVILCSWSRNITVFCKYSKLGTLINFQDWVIPWCYHYLQHLGIMHFEDSLW